MSILHVLIKMPGGTHRQRQESYLDHRTWSQTCKNHKGRNNAESKKKVKRSKLKTEEVKGHNDRGTHRQSPLENTTTLVGKMLVMSSSALYKQLNVHWQY